VETIVAWWVQSTRWDGMSGAPSGDPEWPRPGGRLRQRARLVAAVDVLRSEIRWVKSRSEPEDKGKAARKARKK
jgi:hypothetical protein